MINLPIEIDANKFEHAKFCAMELYNAVVDGKYEMALSFLRGFRDIFGQSMIDQIRRMYVGKFILIITRSYGELTAN